ncbi:Sulfate/thiosulfate import ATP-binding protein CysA [Candidatus Entotheonellaceae bacterium PAL068K]
MPPARLLVTITKRLTTFPLCVQLHANSEILVLFGPSGAGKSMTLHAIAGLMTPESGEIVLDGRPFFRKRRSGAMLHVAARKRRVGYVFQHHTLFPHMTAMDNVAYALRRRNRGQQALALLERMRLTHLADRYPRQLSGGQQQRVAMARALAAKPHILLLDEPFSGLDVAVRDHLQQDLRRLQKEWNLVVVYVTHNLEEAFAVGHSLALIREGQVEQIGPLTEVFRRPATSHAAAILGVRNLFQARAVETTSEGLLLDWGGLLLEAPLQRASIGDTVAAYIRPEDIKVLYPDRPLSSAVRYNQVTGKIIENRSHASFNSLRVRICNGQDVEVRFPAYVYTPLRLSAGEHIRLSLRKEAVVILPGKTLESI